MKGLLVKDLRLLAGQKRFFDGGCDRILFHAGRSGRDIYGQLLYAADVVFYSKYDQLR